MIFRDRVGGGGRAKTSLDGAACAREERRRILTNSLAGMAGDLGDVGRYEEAEDEALVEAHVGRDSALPTAGGGSSNAIRRAEDCEPSFPLISVDEAGVGGCSGSGMIRENWRLKKIAGVIAR
jgi:hypothetical protein